MALPVEDLAAIDQLICRYNFAFDQLDADSFADCFTDDGSFYLGDQEQARGRAALADYVASTPAPGQLRHVVTSVLADVDGSTASSQCYCTVFASAPGNGYQVLAQGVYQDRLAKDVGGWRFTRRRFEQDPA